MRTMPWDFSFLLEVDELSKLLTVCWICICFL